jgi:CHAT domain-containing protein
VKNGEGVYNLQRAFKVSDAKTILMSLWKVDDTATQELMTSFYDTWLKSGDKRQAFRQAQQQIHDKYKLPEY